MENIFERATRQAYRFQSANGLLTTEDLWSLPLQSKSGRANLDDVARTVSNELNEKQSESFVPTASSTPLVNELTNKLEIVKHIIQRKVDENAAKLERAKLQERKKLLLEARAKQEVDSVLGMSVEEIDKELASIG